MNWIDVCGPPGVGKSTICDPIWGPHDIVPEDIPPPAEWHDFCNEVTRLLNIVSNHRSFVAAVRMNRRSIRKMATVAADSQDRVYIQTGFIQRGLGFGWRINDMGLPVDELFHFFRLMPVSIGAVFLEADIDEVLKRNRAREDVPETAHENRSHMVEKMKPAIELAKEVLNSRGVPIKQYRTDEQSAVTIRADIHGMEGEKPCNPAPVGSGSQVSTLLPPAWW